MHNNLRVDAGFLNPCEKILLQNSTFVTVDQILQFKFPRLTRLDFSFSIHLAIAVRATKLTLWTPVPSPHFFPLHIIYCVWHFCTHAPLMTSRSLDNNNPLQRSSNKFTARKCHLYYERRLVPVEIWTRCARPQLVRDAVFTSGLPHFGVRLETSLFPSGEGREAAGVRPRTRYTRFNIQHKFGGFAQWRPTPWTSAQVSRC